MLKSVVETIEQVDEKFRDVYVPEKGPEDKETGRYILAVEPYAGYELANTTNLRKALDTERGDAKRYKSELTKYEGIDPTIYKSTVEELQALKDADPANEEHINDLVAKRTESAQQNFAKQIESYKAEAAKREEMSATERAQLKSILNKSLVSEKAYQLAKDISISPELMAPHIEPYLKLSIEGDRASVLVVDENGNPRAGKDFSTPMTTQELIEEISKNPRFAPLVKGSETSGAGGAQPRQDFGAGAKKYDPKASLAERAAAIAARSKK